MIHGTLSNAAERPFAGGMEGSMPVLRQAAISTASGAR